MTDDLEKRIAAPKWLVVPYGNAVVDRLPESEWSWCVNRDDDTESIEVESKARAEEIAAFMNAGGAAALSELRSLRERADELILQIARDQDETRGWRERAEAAERSRSMLLGMVAELLDTMNVAIEVTTELGPAAGMELVADHLNNTDGVSENNAALPTDWLMKWGPFTGHVSWSGWPEHDRRVNERFVAEARALAALGDSPK